eukprot:TRINITY_DN2497_c0_g1_i1.p1 TRINITY_DN2497_c0_g1~~TRINITY_DN2497_c0_g1_i1.p1  ORF type:complete len:386 (+),score=105.15 TRINITY_DN2497_c0_g1_i1:60-1160(+)
MVLPRVVAVRVSGPTVGRRHSTAFMRAVKVRPSADGKPQATDLFLDDTVPVPSLKARDDVLIRVRATAVNRADIMQRRGLYPPPPGASDILGLEAAGEVCAVGEGVTSLCIGDPVMALLTGGGYAEYCVADARCCIPIPAGIPWRDAAAIPEVFLTAYQCLFLHANLRKGQSVLIHAGASGVGLAAVQLCKAAGASHIITTSSASKTQVCMAHGATVALSRERSGPHAPLFSADVLDVVGPKGVDIILDPVFGSYMQENAEVLATDGVVVVIAMMGGATFSPPVDMRVLFRKRASLKFSTLRSTSPEYKADLVARFWAFAAPRFRTGELHPVVHAAVPWADVSAAHLMVEKDQSHGKVVLLVGDQQ